MLKLNRREWLAAAVAPAMAAVKPVKITGLEFYDADIPTPKDQLEVGVQGRYTVVEVQTDAGVTGYSFAGYPAAQAPALRRIIVGQDLVRRRGPCPQWSAQVRGRRACDLGRDRTDRQAARV